MTQPLTSRPGPAEAALAPDHATLAGQIRPALVLLGLLTGILGLAYPLAITGLGQTLFPRQANGSLLTDPETGAVTGSALIGQAVTGADLFHPRPSAAGAGQDAMASGGSNLGPTSAKLAARIAADVAALRADGFAGPIPADAVTASGSGLDPDISPAFARAQIPRIARARGIAPETLYALVTRETETPLAGLIGEPRVNVAALNRALRATAP